MSGRLVVEGTPRKPNCLAESSVESLIEEAYEVRKWALQVGRYEMADTMWRLIAFIEYAADVGVE